MKKAPYMLQYRKPDTIEKLCEEDGKAGINIHQFIIWEQDTVDQTVSLIPKIHEWFIDHYLTPELYTELFTINCYPDKHSFVLDLQLCQGDIQHEFEATRLRMRKRVVLLKKLLTNLQLQYLMIIYCIIQTKLDIMLVKCGLVTMAHLIFYKNFQGRE